MTRFVPNSAEALIAWLDGDDARAEAINKNYSDRAGFLQETRLIDDLTEIYGECTDFVSQKEVDHLHTLLSPEEFQQLSTRLGWVACNTEGTPDAA